MAGQNSPPATTASGAYREYASYWSIVWEQFVKNRPSYFALLAVVGLFATAIYAPVGASKMPFLWIDESGVAFPWFCALLFNRNIYASSIDLFFNLLLVLSPVGVLLAVLGYAVGTYGAWLCGQILRVIAAG
jgi:ABC-type microcin C transport system permease subunit YejE